MKKWMILVSIGGTILILASAVIYFIRIGVCFPASLPPMSTSEAIQFRQSCSLDSPRVVQFSGFLVLFLPGILLTTAYWLVRPAHAQIHRDGPLTSFLLFTLFDTVLLAVLALLSYPSTGSGSGKAALFMAAFGLAGYISLLGIWQWRRWGLLVFQAVTVLLIVYSGMTGLNMFPASIGIFSAIYLTLVLRPLRSRME